MNDQEHFRDLSGVAARDSPYVRGRDAAEPHDVRQDDRPQGRRELRVAHQPVEHSDPEAGAGEDPEKLDQRRRWVRRNRPDSEVPRNEHDAEAETRRLVGGLLDVVVETAGAVPAVELSTRLAREGGRVVLLGIAGDGRELTLPADRIPLRDLSIFGSVGYTTAAWSRMVALLSEQLVDLDPIVTHRYPLERFEDAFALMDDRQGVVARIVLEHAV